MRGALSVSGVIGTWAGPRSQGTAYVMAHHKIGDVGDGKLGAWGFPEGGMGAVTQALRDAAESFGATVRTGADVARIVVRGGEARGVVARDRRGARRGRRDRRDAPADHLPAPARRRPSSPTTSSMTCAGGRPAAAR